MSCNRKKVLKAKKSLQNELNIHKNILFWTLNTDNKIISFKLICNTTGLERKGDLRLIFVNLRKIYVILRKNW
jgi:hypothetical protein